MTSSYFLHLSLEKKSFQPCKIWVHEILVLLLGLIWDDEVSKMSLVGFLVVAHVLMWSILYIDCLVWPSLLTFSHYVTSPVDLRVDQKISPDFLESLKWMSRYLVESYLIFDDTVCPSKILNHVHQRHIVRPINSSHNIFLKEIQFVHILAWRKKRSGLLAMELISTLL